MRELRERWFNIFILAMFFICCLHPRLGIVYSTLIGFSLSIVCVKLALVKGRMEEEIRKDAPKRDLKKPSSNLKKLQRNPLYLYTGQPCAICDTDEPVSDRIEGCDIVDDTIIAERADWNPSIIKPILRDISDMTDEEGLEVANIAWWALGNKKIEKVEVKRTPIFPYTAIYFDWAPDQERYDSAEDKEEYIRNCGDVEVSKFVLSLDNAHHTIKLYKIIDEENGKTEIMQPYQSHKVTAYLLSKGFNLGILEEGTYIIRNNK